MNKKTHLENFIFKHMPYGDNDKGNDISIKVYLNDEQIAYLNCYEENGRLYSFEVFVEEQYRRIGIATRMYNMAEEITGLHLYPHHENPYNYDENNVSDDALAFWNKRRQK